MFLWMAPFDGSGFGSEAANIVQTLINQMALDKNKLWIDATHDQGTGCESLVVSNAQREILAPAMRNWKAWKKSHVNAIIGVVVCHSLPPFWTPSDGETASEWSSCAPCPPPGTQVGVRIGRAMVETDRYHPKFVRIANDMDEIWVPSVFSRDILAASGVDTDKITIIPIPVDTDRFSPESVEPASLPMGDLLFPTLQNEASMKLRGSASVGVSSHGKKPFLFLSTFKWEPRKGWDTLIEAFVSAFKSSDDVALYILTKPNGGSLEGIRKDVRDHLKSINRKLTKWTPLIRIIASQLSSEDYVRVYRAADIYVTASRGEGWGMPITEAMAMGLPIISTNWSGSADIIHTDYAWPINYTLEDVARPEDDPAWWFEHSKWARANATELKDVMKFAYLHKEECREKGKAARNAAVERYSIAAVASVIRPQLDRVRKVGREKKFNKEENVVSNEFESKHVGIEGWHEEGYMAFEPDYRERFGAYFNRETRLDRRSENLDDLLVNRLSESSGNSKSYDHHHDGWGSDEAKAKAKVDDEGLFTWPEGFHEKEEEDQWGSELS